jgi:hypothetical protein
MRHPYFVSEMVHMPGLSPLNPSIQFKRTILDLILPLQCQQNIGWLDKAPITPVHRP